MHYLNNFHTNCFINAIFCFYPSCFLWLLAVTFEICVRNRYILGKAYNKLLRTVDRDIDSELAELEQAKVSICFENVIVNL